MNNGQIQETFRQNQNLVTFAAMIQIDDVILSSELFEKKFVCDLSACKGACCVEGDVGAPVEESELEVMDKIYELVKPYMRKEGIEAVEAQGKYIRDSWDNEWVTPLVKGKECAYVNFDPDGTAKCSIEQAYRDNKIEFPKPVSCHLYPIRVKKYRDFEAVNYDRWDICSDACKLGDKLGVKVFEFTKEPLIRKYGESFYKELEQIDQSL
ncbi:DUF3109 family protein [Salibacter sp.]|uniref:DUF3109 family protein n=1 Tax=Salibacter sp. TaxID=2010995 RepID=UPI0038F677F8